MAAAKDLGLKNKTQNGFFFCGLAKPTRSTTGRLTRGALVDLVHELAAELLTYSPESDEARTLLARADAVG